MMKSFARIQGGVFVELIASEVYDAEAPDWDESQPSRIGQEIPIVHRFTAELVAAMVDITGMDPPPKIGWSAIETDGVWTLAEPVFLPPTDDELKASALALRAELLAAANTTTAGMTDAFVAGLLDEADTHKFKAYAAYKLALNKIDQQPDYPQTIAWPALPETAGVAQ